VHPISATTTRLDKTPNLLMDPPAAKCGKGRTGEPQPVSG
jgi:hypothetical protein